MLCRMTYAKPDRTVAGHTFWTASVEDARLYARAWEDQHEDHILLTLKRVASKEAAFRTSRPLGSAASNRALARLKEHFNKERV